MNLRQSAKMTAKELVLNTVERLPDNVSLEEITKRLDVIAGIQKGLDSLNRGEGKSIDEVEKLMSSWITK
jgi:predicted transcriptional regulator